MEVSDMGQRSSVAYYSLRSREAMARAQAARAKGARLRMETRKKRLLVLHKDHTRAECAKILGVSVDTIETYEKVLEIACKRVGKPRKKRVVQRAVEQPAARELQQKLKAWSPV